MEEPGEVEKLMELEASWQEFIWVVRKDKKDEDVLKIGVSVGVQQWPRMVGDFVKGDAIEKAVKEIMVGDRVGEMRSRAKELGEMSMRAIEKEGSSYSDLNGLIDELRLSRNSSK
ncbi:hypothetical protein EZV62_011264 [Acer yangbiense]|uniref:Uncharacterized protein n=1 Tax=Acer yangbiense TaxID=1000413 RepID=A0A5C7I4T1_9ROSI|nr:hypothetical protein EZV62_011264 [Acer yangbiense]